MIELARVERACQNAHFKERVFTKEERRQAARSSARLAGDFAVKEAIAKAFGLGFRMFELRDIACLRDEKGAPYVELYGKAKTLSQSLGIVKIHVSISNTKTYAVASVILEQSEAKKNDFSMREPLSRKEETAMEDIPCSRIYAKIDLDAIRANMLAMKAKLPETCSLCAVVKADGYGHGAAYVAKEIDDLCKLYAVASAEEGVRLRESGINKPVLVLGSVLLPEYETALENDLTLTVFRLEQAKQLGKAAEKAGKTAHIHLAVDTGMGRIGLTPDETGVKEAKAIASVPHVQIDGVFTHFAKADETDKTSAKKQIAKFCSFREQLKTHGVDTAAMLWHCANSAGIIENLGLDGFDLARAGVSLYGLFPSDETGKHIVLQPAMSLHAYLTFVKEVPKGTEISYGGTYRTPHAMRVGTVSCGYADGYLRALSGKGAEVLIAGKRCPVLGRICMDQLMVDLSNVPEAGEGTPVTLLGQDGSEQITVEELAQKSGGFHYEILCGISRRVPRVYVKENRITAISND